MGKPARLYSNPDIPSIPHVESNLHIAVAFVLDVDLALRLVAENNG